MRNIEKYIEGYDICQRMKNRIEIPAGKLKLMRYQKGYRLI